MQQGRPRLLLVEDHRLFRAGIRSLLANASTSYEILGEAADGLNALRLAKSLAPDLILMDVTMPERNGIETTRTLLKEQPATRILMLSMHNDPTFVRAAMDAGAFGYVLKDDAFADLEAAIRSALRGEKYLSPDVAKRLKTDSPLTHGPASRDVAQLSARERQILQLIAEAFTSPEIAGKLHLSTRTVETYRQRMMDKLDLHSVAALTAFAIRHGLCSPENPDPRPN